MKTKTITLVLLSLFIQQISLKAQEADQKIGELLNSSDWFTLEEEYPKAKESIQTPLIKSLSEVMIGLYFNAPQKALEQIDTLLTNYRQELGFENICGMVAFKSQILAKQGRYGESVDNLNSFLDQIAAFVKKEDCQGLVDMASYYGKLRNQPGLEIVRPDKDVVIPMTIEKAGRGELMFVPVTIKGKEYKFIFDTGAGTTFMSQEFADKVGVRTVVDSIKITGVKTGYGRQGTIDSLCIGDIIFKHPVITVAPPNPEVDTVYKVDAVLGIDFIRMVGESQLFPQEGKICFPQNQTPLPATGRNLMLLDQPYAKLYSNGERLIFHFDTGNVTSDLFTPYYLRHKEKIETEGVKDTISGGGYGGIRKMEGYRLSQVPFKVGSTDFELKNISAYTDVTTDVERQEDGSLGMSFIQLFQQVIINFDKMFLEVKK